jgi:predicted nucleic acid binding AN1-type Zn finger protein
MEFEEKLTKAKEWMFKDYVIEASKILNLPFTPEVKIWDEACPYSRPNEIAHAHPDTHLICISRSILKDLTLEEIKETAIHETVHMLYFGHDIDFHTTLSETELFSWILEHFRPEIEIKKRRGRIKLKEIKIDKNVCNYHLCKKRDKLRKCHHCKGLFCKEHIKPRIPGIPSPTSTKKEDIAFMEEYHKPGGHPCFPYVDYWKAEQERKEKEYMKALDRLIKSKPLGYEISVSEPIDLSERIKTKSSEEESLKKSKRHTNYCNKCFKGLDKNNDIYCSFCKQHFCSSHILPENHDCINRPKNIPTENEGTQIRIPETLGWIVLILIIIFAGYILYSTGIINEFLKGPEKPEIIPTTTSIISTTTEETTTIEIKNPITYYVTPDSVKPYLDKIRHWFENDTEKDLDWIQQYVSEEIRYTVIPHTEWRLPIETLQGDGYGDCKDRATTFVSLAKAYNSSIKCFCVGLNETDKIIGHLTAFCRVKNIFMFYDYGKIKTWRSTGFSVENSEILGLLSDYFSEYDLLPTTKVMYAFDDKNYYEFKDNNEFVEWTKNLFG